MGERALDETASAAPSTPVAEVAGPAPSGPGLQKLNELLARGRPSAAEVVELIDAHRGEKDAILASLQTSLGNGFVSEVLSAMDGTRWHLRRREVVHGDPTSADGGFFIASEAERGARWRTEGGGHTGSLDGHGLRTRTRVDEDTAVLGSLDTGSRTATLGLEEDGRVVGEAYGRYRGAADWGVGARAPLALDGGATVTPEARHVVRGDGATDELAASYRATGTGADAVLGRHESGQIVGSLSGSHQLDPRTSLSGSLSHDTTTSAASVGASHRLSDTTTLSGSLGHTHSHVDGGDQTTLSLSERTRSPDLIHGLDVTAGAGTRDYLSVTGSTDLRLGPQLFASGFGGLTVEDGRETAAHAGGSLTFTPHEKAALTLAGIVDQDGRLETRLQLDIFKKKLGDLGSFADHKRDALVSLFLSYQPAGPGPRRLDDRFGGSQIDTGVGGDERVTAGIRIRF
ncbi:MAG TPA: hypothetical protein VM261_24450 [Kofleriaceae bacterium]|nr:hypothetical protein [Kofleriaceae bacterium]